MTIPFFIYKFATTAVTKTIQFFGNNAGKIVIGSGAALAVGGAKVQKDINEKKKTLIHYKQWDIWFQGKFIIAKNGNEKLKIQSDDIKDMKRMIDAKE